MALLARGKDAPDGLPSTSATAGPTRQNRRRQKQEAVGSGQRAAGSSSRWSRRSSLSLEPREVGRASAWGKRS